VDRTPRGVPRDGHRRLANPLHDDAHAALPETGTKKTGPFGPCESTGRRPGRNRLPADAPSVDHATFRRRTNLGLPRHRNLPCRGHFNPASGRDFNPARRNRLDRLADLDGASRCLAPGATNAIRALQAMST
jgi:hypothetical protein